MLVVREEDDVDVADLPRLPRGTRRLGEHSRSHRALARRIESRVDDEAHAPALDDKGRPTDPCHCVVVPDSAHLFEASVPLSVYGVDRTASGAPPLRVAVTTTADQQQIRTTAGLVVSGFSPLAVVDTAGVVIVPTWPDPAAVPPVELVEALHRAVEEGATVMGLCMGAYALGHAGLLDGRRATTHWHWMADFSRRFPGTRADETSLFVDEGSVITSAGTAAALDACLHHVRREWGAASANAIARRMVVAPRRAGTQRQFVDPEPVRADVAPIAAVQERALAALAEGVVVDDLARWYGTSRRTFDRDFRAAVGESPLQWLLHQRVLRAQQLLESSDLSVEEVAHRTGFSSAVALRPHVRRVLGVSPQRYRESFAQTVPPTERSTAQHSTAQHSTGRATPSSPTPRTARLTP
ncbi:transcriptional regulator, AraC family with amidase-like domain [Quadrisphaera granulorum]|uniref:AraC family transcriptional regulator with amidase-like domain n=1 Tax=Quadrisphaera granulorum TaxID=317664 RepID=A0A316A5I7_9ACTN|nr:helix-turn-helix domain-containing protein [Quadrisphaera granulorum]PWJ52955.1 AraC family transcriptional regulator with amidase-like domain [Quadrisphaera granulorum]SZE97337.1 transcriptional regulator, AraC family with amidase-like domain [Quadrisphaera granulorum]